MRHTVYCANILVQHQQPELNMFTLYPEGLCWRCYDQSPRHPCAGVGQSTAHPDLLLPVKSCHHTSGDGSRTHIPPCATQLLWYILYFQHVFLCRREYQLRTRAKSLCFLLSGPGVNKAVLLQLQQAKAKASEELEIKSSKSQAYENMSYEDDEMKQDPDSNFKKVSTDSSTPSKVIENQQENYNHF